MVGIYRRKVSTKKFILAFILTAAIVAIGLLIVSILTQERSQYLETIAYQQKLDYESLQLQSLYLDIKSNNVSCTTFNNILASSLSNVGAAQSKVDQYIKESNTGIYRDIKRDYALAQIRYWLLNQRSIESCQLDHVSVLYFYSNEDCIECGAQGTILSYLKQQFKGDLLVFSIDADFKKEPMIGILKQTYNISTIPSLVVNDKVFNTLVGRSELTQEICSQYVDPPAFCVTSS